MILKNSLFLSREWCTMMNQMAFIPGILSQITPVGKTQDWNVCTLNTFICVRNVIPATGENVVTYASTSNFTTALWCCSIICCVFIKDSRFHLLSGNRIFHSVLDESLERGFRSRTVTLHQWTGYFQIAAVWKHLAIPRITLLVTGAWWKSKMRNLGLSSFSSACQYFSTFVSSCQSHLV